MTKSIALGLLTLAVSTSLTLAQDAPMGGWSAKPGSGLKYDGGDAFGLSFSNQLQVHYTYMAADNGVVDTNNFRIRRARTTLAGHVFNKNIEYKLQVDANDTGAGIKEGHVTWNFMNSDSGTIGLRFGQGKVLYGLEGTGTSKGLFFAERSLAAQTFSDGYSRGAWLTGRYAESKLRWVLGAMNQLAGEEAANDDNELAYVAAVNFDPLGDYFGGKQTTESKTQGDFRKEDQKMLGTIGASFSQDNNDIGAATPVDLEVQVLNLNTAWSVSGFQAMGEWFQATGSTTGVGDVTSDGWAVSGMYVLPPSGDSSLQWGFGARVSQVDLTEVLGDDVTDVSLVANAFYHGHACKTQFDLTMRDFDVADATDYIFTVAFQLLF